MYLWSKRPRHVDTSDGGNLLVVQLEVKSCQIFGHVGCIPRTRVNQNVLLHRPQNQRLSVSERIELM